MIHGTQSVTVPATKEALAMLVVSTTGAPHVTADLP